MGQLRVIEPGMLTIVQDLGRPGFSAIGVARGGAADPLSLRIGNRLVGNADNTPSLEMTMLGGSFAFEHDAVIALTGGHVSAAIVGEAGTRDCPMSCPISIRAGERLTTGPIVRGVRTYLCIAGGIAVPRVMESASTHLGAGFGGVHGRALRRGDAVQFGDTPASPARPSLASNAARLLEQVLKRRPIRALDGAHAGEFDESMLRNFWSQSFNISARSDRVGVRLVGRIGINPEPSGARRRDWRSSDPNVEKHAAHPSEGLRPSARTGRDLVPTDTGTRAGSMPSEGMMCGAVQIPPDAEPIILMVDHPTTGGYPVIACVATVDLPVLGQLRPGESIRFEHTTLADARALFRQREQELNEQVPPL